MSAPITSVEYRTDLNVEMHKVVSVEDVEAEKRLSKEGIQVEELEEASALQLLLQRSLAKLGLNVQTLVLDPRLFNGAKTTRRYFFLCRR